MADLPSIEAPTLLLAGAAEPFVAQAQAAARLLPYGMFVPLSGLDHVQTFFRGDLFLPYVRDFFARALGTQASRGGSR